MPAYRVISMLVRSSLFGKINQFLYLSYHMSDEARQQRRQAAGRGGGGAVEEARERGNMDGEDTLEQQVMTEVGDSDMSPEEEERMLVGWKSIFAKRRQELKQTVEREYAEMPRNEEIRGGVPPVERAKKKDRYIEEEEY